MIPCVVCGTDVELKRPHGILVSPDGDFACSEACEDKYKKDRDHFFNFIITDDKAFSDWLGVPLSSL